MPVPAADAVGAHGAHDLRAEQVGLERLAGARGAARRDHDDVLAVGEATGDRGQQCQGDRGRVAARNGDPAGAGQSGALAGEFGQPIGPGAGVRRAVEGLPRLRVEQPVVGAGVDDEHVGAEFGGQGGRGTVGQREEDHVVAGEGLCRRVGDHPVSQGREVLVVGEQGCPGAGARGQRPEFDLGMGQQQPEQLTAGIAGRPGHGYGVRHRHYYAESGMIIPVGGGGGPRPVPGIARHDVRLAPPIRHRKSRKPLNVRWLP